MVVVLSRPERKPRIANKEKVRLYNQKYHAANGQKIREKKRERRNSNPEELRLRDRKYYAANAEREREKQRKWTEANPEKRRAIDVKYHAENKEKRVAKAIKWNRMNPEKHEESKRKWFATHTEHRKEYAKRNRQRDLDSQRRRMGIPMPTRPCPQVCECCGRISEKSLHIDHDHKTGKFRGWLCGRCNRGIGLLNDNCNGVQRAAAYLRFANPERATLE